MITSEVTTKIVFDDEDVKDLIAASRVLHEIDDALAKTGLISVDNEDRQKIRGAIGVIDSILSGETF